MGVFYFSWTGARRQYNSLYGQGCFYTSFLKSVNLARESLRQNRLKLTRTAQLPVG